MTWELQHGDCRQLMAAMEGCSVDSIVTDPPYELGFMGREWDRSGVAYDAAMWRAALDVLKPGGWLVAFGGARTYHRMACAIEDAGFDIRDQIMWIYGSGFPKGGNRDGKGTCLKPAHEPIVLARKPLIGSVTANEAAFGTGALNIDACRVGTSGARNNGRQAGTNGIYGHIGATTPVDYGMGRWPANIVHDGSDEIVDQFPTAAGAVAPPSRNGSQTTRAAYGTYLERSDVFHGDTGSAARFFYCAKASKADRDEGLDQFTPQAFVQFQTSNGESGAASSLGAGRDTQYRNVHPTVKPEALMRWLVRLVTPVGGLVLDPFTGSGSTGKAALLEQRSFVGCELTDAYIPIAQARIAAAVQRAAREQREAEAGAAPPPQMRLFTDEAAA